MNLPLVAAAAAPALCTQCLPPAWLTCDRDAYPRNDEGGREDQRNNAVAQGKSSIRALPCFGNLIFCHHTCHLGPLKYAGKYLPDVVMDVFTYLYSSV